MWGLHFSTHAESCAKLKGQEFFMLVMSAISLKKMIRLKTTINYEINYCASIPVQKNLVASD